MARLSPRDSNLWVPPRLAEGVEHESAPQGLCWFRGGARSLFWRGRKVGSIPRVSALCFRPLSLGMTFSRPFPLALNAGRHRQLFFLADPVSFLPSHMQERSGWSDKIQSDFSGGVRSPAAPGNLFGPCPLPASARQCCWCTGGCTGCLSCF